MRGWGSRTGARTAVWGPLGGNGNAAACLCPDVFFFFFNASVRRIRLKASSKGHRTVHGYTRCHMCSNSGLFLKKYIYMLLKYAVEVVKVNHVGVF